MTTETFSLDQRLAAQQERDAEASIAAYADFVMRAASGESFTDAAVAKLAVQLSRLGLTRQHFDGDVEIAKYITDNADFEATFEAKQAELHAQKEVAAEAMEHHRLARHHAEIRHRGLSNQADGNMAMLKELRAVRAANPRLYATPEVAISCKQPAVSVDAVAHRIHDMGPSSQAFAPEKRSY